MKTFIRLISLLINLKTEIKNNGKLKTKSHKAHFACLTHKISILKYLISKRHINNMIQYEMTVPKAAPTTPNFK